MFFPIFFFPFVIPQILLLYTYKDWFYNRESSILGGRIYKDVSVIFIVRFVNFIPM